MRTIRSLSLLLLFAISGCGVLPSFHHDNATGYYVTNAEQCVPYARRISGIQLYGDADGWWHQAASHYQRGPEPTPGAVLVLKKTSHMRSGHVAVVKAIKGSRTITVTHSHWGNSYTTKHIIYDSMLAEDVSENGDWTQVRFWNDDKNTFGFPYAAYGFIYPH